MLWVYCFLRFDHLRLRPTFAHRCPWVEFDAEIKPLESASGASGLSSGTNFGSATNALRWIAHHPFSLRTGRPNVAMDGMFEITCSRRAPIAHAERDADGLNARMAFEFNSAKFNPANRMALRSITTESNGALKLFFHAASSESTLFVKIISSSLALGCKPIVTLTHDANPVA